MRRTGARRLAPILLALVAVAGLLGTGQAGDGPAAAVPGSATAVWAATAGIEAVLPARLETAFERSGLTNSSKPRPPVGAVVLPLLLACVLARRQLMAADVPTLPAVSSSILPERGPPPRRFALI